MEKKGKGQDPVVWCLISEKFMIRLLVNTFVLICAVVGYQSNTTAEDFQEADFHGFHIDAHLLNDIQKASILPTVVNQLTIVESVGLPNNVISFFRKIPILVDPTLQNQPGMYVQKGELGVVRIQPMFFPQNKPILLHELLHAYHFSILTTKNQEILKAYDNAIQSKKYPAEFHSAHFLKDPAEYFAVMGTIYLFGKIQQPPFDCAVMSNSQPEYLVFLANEFSVHECK